MNKDLRITITLLACAFVGLLAAGTIITLIVKELKQEAGILKQQLRENFTTLKETKP